MSETSLARFQMSAERLARRKVVNVVATFLALSFTLLAVTPLFSVIYEVWKMGHGVVTLEFLTEKPGLPSLPGGGIYHAIIGTGMVVGIGSLIGVPFGMLVGIFLSEYGPSRFADSVRLVADVMTGIPSIVAGLFAYILIVSAFDFGFSAIAGGVALAVIMLPIVTRTTEESLRTVPQSYREAALALGAPRWYTILFVVLPASIGPVLTGILLAVARITGETAPLLLTTLTSFFVVTDPRLPVATLPGIVYDWNKAPYDAQIAKSWGTALVLLAIVLIVNITVRLLSRRRIPRI